MQGLGAFILARREAMGLNQTQFAERAGIGRSHLAQIESGKITFPNAEYRRNIARALGVSHLDILIAAGELLPEEVADAGKVGVPEASPVIEAMITALRSLPWDRQDVELAHAVLTRRIPDAAIEQTAKALTDLVKGQSSQ